MQLTNDPSNSECRLWWKKYSVILTIGLTASVSFLQLWNAGYKQVASAVSFVSFGIAYLYWTVNARDRVTSKQVVVVTGCDSGLGYSLALHCRFLGAIVVAGVLQRDGPGARRLTERGVLVYPLDITDETSVKEFRRNVSELLKQRDLVLRTFVNNAAIMIFGEFEWQTESQVRRQVEVNLLGTMRVTREFMPTFRANSSRVIMISSHCSSEPLPGVAVYGATKAAISAWATAIRVELKKYGIKVVCFVPGSFTRESNILAQQRTHFEEMKLSMSDEAKDFYGDYFVRYAEYFAPMAREIEPKALGNSIVYHAFRGALLDRYPSAVYKCEPWRYFFYHTLFKITPTCLRDRLIEGFVCLPSWRDKANDNAPTASIPLPSRHEIFRSPQSKIIAENSGLPSDKINTEEDGRSPMETDVRSKPDSILAGN